MDYILGFIGILSAVATGIVSWLKLQQALMEKRKVEQELADRTRFRVHDFDAITTSTSPASLDSKCFKILPSLYSELCEIDNSVPPSIIDDNIYFVENECESETVVVFLSGLGLDYRDFIPFISRCDKYYCLSPAMFGFQPDATSGVKMSLDAHVWLIAAFLNSKLKSRPHSRIIFVGFSIGADIGMKLISSPSLRISIHGFLGLDPNINRDTCFISRKVAELSIQNQQSNALKIVRQISLRKFSTFQRWVNIHRYLIKVFTKFDLERIEVLQHVASEVVSQFPDESLDAFLSAYCQAAKHVDALRLVFSDDRSPDDNVGEHATLIDQIKHRLTSQNAPVQYIPDSLAIHDYADHFDLIEDLHILDTYIVKLTEDTKREFQ